MHDPLHGLSLAKVARSYEGDAAQRERWRAASGGQAGTLTSRHRVSPADVDGPDDGEFPGVFPYTRGPYASMYRSKLWTMRMFAGFGTADDTNWRFKEILKAGGDGLSTAFDMPTLMGMDSDDVLSEGEVGRCGVAVDTLADMEDLYRDIDVGAITTSMTINSPAAVIWRCTSRRPRKSHRTSSLGHASRTTSSRVQREDSCSAASVMSLLRTRSRHAARAEDGIDSIRAQIREPLDGGARAASRWPTGSVWGWHSRGLVVDEFAPR